jgi:hypothetical protein
MPSRIGEGLHRVVFPCALSCGCETLYSVRPTAGDYVLCFRHNASATVLTVTRRYIVTTAA